MGGGKKGPTDDAAAYDDGIPNQNQNESICSLRFRILIAPPFTIIHYALQ